MYRIEICNSLFIFFKTSFFLRTCFRVSLYYKQHDQKKSVKKNYRFQKAAMFRIYTEERYYFIMELFLFCYKYLFLEACGKQLANSKVRKCEQT
jgi:hypothetical protein